MKTMLLILFILLFIGPLLVLFSGKVDLHGDYRTADRKSSGLAPAPEHFPDAIILVYSARTFSWRGLFAVHTWFAVKPKNAEHYKIYQVVGWRLFRGLSPLMMEDDVPDRIWFGNKPVALLDIRGTQAEQLIPQIAEAAKEYPYPDQYVYWPGPNSNTFTAFIARKIPQLGLTLPSIAIGKDYLPRYQFFTKAPSGTGVQFSILGLFGFIIAKKEGLELNILGLVIGIKPMDFAIELPGIGEIRKGMT